MKVKCFIMAPFWDVCPGFGDSFCHGPAHTQQSMRLCVPRPGMVEMQNGYGLGGRCSTPGILHGCSSPLHSQAITAWQLTLALLITNHRDKVGAMQQEWGSVLVG